MGVIYSTAAERHDANSVLGGVLDEIDIPEADKIRLLLAQAIERARALARLGVQTNRRIYAPDIVNEAELLSCILHTGDPDATWDSEALKEQRRIEEMKYPQSVTDHPRIDILV